MSTWLWIAWPGRVHLTLAARDATGTWWVRWTLCNMPRRGPIAWPSDTPDRPVCGACWSIHAKQLAMTPDDRRATRRADR